MSVAHAQAANELVDIGADLYARGWLPATSGNLSIRTTGDRMAITASGTHKGRLDLSDILDADMAGNTRSGRKPSAETRLHTGLYEARPAVGAVLHVHSPSATVLSRMVSSSALVLEGWELQKALTGVKSHEERIYVPIIDNSQNMAELAAAAESALSAQPRSWGYLIRGHGLYAWASDAASALRHLEALDFLFRCELELRRHS